MRIRSALPAVLIITLGACAATPAANTGADEQAIREISARWLELERGRDAAAIAALFADDGVLYRSQKEPLVGQAAITAHIQQSFQEAPAEAPNWASERVDIAASGDVAVEHGKWSSTGGAEGADQGWYLTEYRKVNGEWRVAADMVVSTKPRAAAGAGM